MEISSEAQKLCHNLISLAIQRCRVSENLCRLSIVLKCSNDRNRSIVRVASKDYIFDSFPSMCLCVWLFD
ncbi:hypothetical protein GIB67_042716 [Kingdonia uniflora]|uniref:Uncharacterized protein n=1 Tax=Kingdonia uniflora TaxID=39325 RepID=A0A7J7NE76_9MAGN|nr:hypothetical protein GIB67_042716 [Kingdonia uniflora]